MNATPLRRFHVAMAAVAVVAVMSTASCGSRPGGPAGASAAARDGFHSYVLADYKQTPLTRTLRRIAYKYRGFVAVVATIGQPLPAQYATADGSRPDSSRADLEGEPTIYTPYPLADVRTLAGTPAASTMTVLVEGGQRGTDSTTASGLVGFVPGQRTLALLGPAGFKGANGRLEVQESFPLDAAGRIFCADRWVVSDVRGGPFSRGKMPVTATGDPARPGEPVQGRWVPLTAILAAAGLRLH